MRIIIYCILYTFWYILFMLIQLCLSSNKSFVVVGVVGTAKKMYKRRRQFDKKNRFIQCVIEMWMNIV